MDYKKSKASTSTITRNFSDFDSKTGNIYEALRIVAKRADQIGTDIKNELNSKLEEFSSLTDSLEEVHENREQIDLSKLYEKMPKPVLLAIEEFLEGDVYFRNPKKEEFAQPGAVEPRQTQEEA